MAKALKILIVLLSVCGVIVASLALQAHYSYKLEPCDINARWDCGIVNHSSFSMIHGIPVATIGIAGYVLLGLLALFGKRGWTLIAAIVGLCFALYFTHIEASILQVWCLYCVMSQGIIALITILAAISLAFRPKRT